MPRAEIYQRHSSLGPYLLSLVFLPPTGNFCVNTSVMNRGFTAKEHSIWFDKCKLGKVPLYLFLFEKNISKKEIYLSILLYIIDLDLNRLNNPF